MSTVLRLIDARMRAAEEASAVNPGAACAVLHTLALLKSDIVALAERKEEDRG